MPWNAFQVGSFKRGLMTDKALEDVTWSALPQLEVARREVPQVLAPTWAKMDQP